MVYDFIQVYEMNFLHTTFSCVAKDIHDAMRKAIESDIDYDVIAVNGEFI